MSLDAPALCVHNNKLYIAWTGTNSLLNIAVINLQGSRVSGFSDKVTLSEMSTQSPALASVNGRLYIGWRGDGNDNLNVASSGDNGKTFGNKYTSSEASKDAPVLCSHNNGLFIAWKGVGNLQLNVASMNLLGPNVTGFNTVTLGETSPDRPALVSFDGKLFLAWRGNGSLNLSLSSSTDNGRTFRSKFVSAETSLACFPRPLPASKTGNSTSPRQPSHGEPAPHGQRTSNHLESETVRIREDRLRP
jgi:hypothetical protein